MSIDDIDLFDVNEAFAPVPLAWLKHTGAHPQKLNANGEAIVASIARGKYAGRRQTLQPISVNAVSQRDGGMEIRVVDRVPKPRAADGKLSEVS